ncbi:ComEA family DNA-binding protein [Rhodohalobacter sp.]|uniref:ComEA family DNA-binding protein n=1 Tax=Rhodohalobacter sp. TaxID=1974210 RepID=UPI00356B60C3
MKRKLFYFFERLQIKRSERIAISLLMVLTVLMTFAYSFTDLIFPEPEFDYSVSDSIFAAKSAQLASEREMILERYRPVDDVKISETSLIHVQIDTIPADSTKESTMAVSDSLININTASAEKLQELPGIGPAYSKRIVEWRLKNGLFVSKEQLLEIKGIGEKRLEAIQPLITL